MYILYSITIARSKRKSCWFCTKHFSFFVTPELKTLLKKKEQKTFRQQNFCCKTPSPTLNAIEELSYRN